MLQCSVLSSNNVPAGRVVDKAMGSCHQGRPTPDHKLIAYRICYTGDEITLLYIPYNINAHMIMWSNINCHTRMIIYVTQPITLTQS